MSPDGPTASGRPAAWGAFDLDPSVHHLNHGSFGAVPRSVLEAQSELRARIERDPMHFFTRRYLDELQAARERLARFVGADPGDVVFVRNATEGVASVLASLALGPGDEVVACDHEYPACVKACRRTGARVIEVPLPLPLTDPAELEARILDAVGPATRLVLLSHVTSPTGLVLPVERLVEALAARGVRVLVDGAHAPGMLALDLSAMAVRGLRLYTANLHKWVCAPKGAAFLWVHPDEHDRIRPAVTSHGHGAIWPGRNALQSAFDWTGTDDPSPFLVAPHAIAAVGALHPAGWPGLRAHNHALALEARAILERRLAVPSLAPPSMIGSLAAVALPPDPGPPRPHALAPSDLQASLHSRGFRIPVSSWPAPPARLLRLSAHVYNHLAEYEALGAIVAQLLDEEPASQSSS